MQIEIDLGALHKAESKGRPGLVKRKVKVHRGGKVFEQYRWVKAGKDEPSEKKSSVKEPSPKPKKETAIMGLSKPEPESEEPDKSEPKWEPNWEGIDMSYLESKDLTLHAGINDMSTYEIDDSTIDELEEILRSGDWNFWNSRFFGSTTECVDACVHVEEDEIYAMSKSLPIDRSMHIMLFEVNPIKQRQGYGIKGIKDIVDTIIGSKEYDKIELISTDGDSDKFYDAIGMVRTNPGEDSRSEYEGDKKWMKRFLQSISEKQ